MRRLSTLIAILLIATIGGVYATWNYAQGEVTSKTVYFDDVTKITDKKVNNAKGVIDIIKNDLAITIDDADNDHYAEWYLTGSLTIKFTPNQGADETVKLNGIDLQWKLSVSDNWKYSVDNIFTVNTETVDIDKGALGADGSFSWEVTAEQLADKIRFYNVTQGSESALKLDTVSEYEAFKHALHSGSIGITVSEKTA